MKTIGKHNDGGYLVHMTEDEHRCMVRLQVLVEGGDADRVNFIWRNDQHSVADLSSVMNVINGWALAKFRLDELERKLVEFREVLEKP